MNVSLEMQSQLFLFQEAQNHRGPTGPVHRQTRRCVWQHQHPNSVYPDSTEDGGGCLSDRVQCSRKTVEIHQVRFIDRIVEVLVVMLRPARSKQCSYVTLLA